LQPRTNFDRLTYRCVGKTITRRPINLFVVNHGDAPTRNLMMMMMHSFDWTLGSGSFAFDSVKCNET